MTEGQFLYEILRRRFKEDYCTHFENPTWESIGKDPERTEHPIWEAIAKEFIEHIEGVKLPP